MVPTLLLFGKGQACSQGCLIPKLLALSHCMHPESNGGRCPLQGREPYGACMWSLPVTHLAGFPAQNMKNP